MHKLLGVSLISLCIATPANAQQIKTVFYIALENHNFRQPSTVTSPPQIFKSPAAPFINSLIDPSSPNSAQVSYASNYQNDIQKGTFVHPSEPNYVSMEAGAAGAPPWTDRDPYPSAIVKAPNLSALLQRKYGTSGWRSYQEDIDLVPRSGSVNNSGINSMTNVVAKQSQWTVPFKEILGHSEDYNNPYTGSHEYYYAPKHNPQIFFVETNGGNNLTPSNLESGYYAPLQQLYIDLANNTVARYNWITPNLFNDMHFPVDTDFTYHGVTYTAYSEETQIAQGDNFLSKIVKIIMASKAYKDNGEIVIWTDESEEGDGPDYPITEIIISLLAKGNAYTNAILYTHRSDLATLQNIFGVAAPGGGYLGDAGESNLLTDLYKPGAIPPGVPK